MVRGHTGGAVLVEAGGNGVLNTGTTLMVSHKWAHPRQSTPKQDCPGQPASVLATSRRAPCVVLIENEVDRNGLY